MIPQHTKLGVQRPHAIRNTTQTTRRPACSFFGHLPRMKLCEKLSILQHANMDNFLLNSQLICHISAMHGWIPAVRMKHRHTIYYVRKIVERLNKGTSTVNICSLDLSKAFDKVNHFGLYIKLMKRFIPVELLEMLENWLSDCFAFVV